MGQGNSAINSDSTNRTVQAMGYFEGYTRKRVFISATTTRTGLKTKTGYCAKPVYDWLVKNHEWVKDQISQNCQTIRRK